MTSQVFFVHTGNRAFAEGRSRRTAHEKSVVWQLVILAFFTVGGLAPAVVAVRDWHIWFLLNRDPDELDRDQ